MSEENKDIKDSEKKDGQPDGYEKVCHICRRPQSKVDRLIDLPNNITICTDCMQKTFDQIKMQGLPIQLTGLDLANMGAMGLESPEEFQRRQIGSTGNIAAYGAVEILDAQSHAVLGNGGAQDRDLIGAGLSRLQSRRRVGQDQIHVVGLLRGA